MSSFDSDAEGAPDSTPPSELLDVVNLDGEPTGLQADKDDIHSEGLWHPDVHVWITDGRNMLEQQRDWEKTIMGGTWDISASGHVRAGESYLEAAQRETAEEVGLQFDTAHFLPAGRMAVEMEMQDGAWVHRTVGDNFVVVDPSLTVEAVQMQEGEVIGVRMYPIDQLEADLADPATAERHAPQPLELWQLGIAAMRAAIEERDD